MSWNDDDMNPWNKKKPSSQPSKEGIEEVDGQDDLDELLKKGQDTVRNIFQKSKQYKKKDDNFYNKNFLWLLLVVIILWGASGFFHVREGENAVVLRFGEAVRTHEAGLRYRLPYPIEKNYIVKVARVNEIKSGKGSHGQRFGYQSRAEDIRDLMLTGDENILRLLFTVQWVIKDIKKFLFHDPDPEETVSVAAESVIREVIAQTNLVQALTIGKNLIVINAKSLLQTLLDEYNIGVEIIKVNLEKVDPPSTVIDSFRDVQRAKADKEKKVNEAKAYSNSIIPVARGNAQTIIQGSEAYKATVINAAQGETSRFLAVLQEYLSAPDVTITRLRIQNSEKILQNVNKYIIDKDFGNGVLPYFQLNKIKQPDNSNDN